MNVGSKITISTQTKIIKHAYTQTVSSRDVASQTIEDNMNRKTHTIVLAEKLTQTLDSQGNEPGDDTNNVKTLGFETTKIYNAPREKEPKQTQFCGEMNNFKLSDNYVESSSFSKVLKTDECASGHTTNRVYSEAKKRKSVAVRITVAVKPFMLLRDGCFFVLTATVLTPIFAENEGYNPCCSFPCQNGGVCVTLAGNKYSCDCTGIGFYGPQCETRTWRRWLRDLIRPSEETLQWAATRFPVFWGIINRVGFLHDFLMTFIYTSRAEMIDNPTRYNSEHDYITLESYFNHSFYARALPKVPENCPTPLGVKGKKSLPDVDELLNKVFLRKKFIPDQYGSNIILSGYAQHFTHQFFKTDRKRGPGFQWGNNGVDASQIHGKDEATRNALRTFKGGKMKSQEKEGEEFPPDLEEAPGVEMWYPANTTHRKFAMGHPFFGIVPEMFVYATIWLREHNRVCDVLHDEHPHWSDEQLYQTARVILVGETLKITAAEYIQHLTQYNLQLTFEPELLHKEVYQYSNRMTVEFNHLYNWHTFPPDGITVGGVRYQFNDLLYNTDPVFQHGFDNFVDAMTKEHAGAMTSNNVHPWFFETERELLLWDRELRFQSFNNYRRMLSLSPYRSFEEFAEDPEVAQILQDLYGDIEALEFFPGMILEKRGMNVLTPSALTIAGPFSVSGIMSNPLCSPKWWRPSTFGGDVGMQIVREATLERLFCQNMKSKCKGIKVAFTVPDDASNDCRGKCNDEL